MREINNPFVDHEGYHCFGCDPNNRFGLKMRFIEEEERVVSHWEPTASYQGFTDVLHGGIQATLMDELASWYVFVKLKTSGMTERLEVRFNTPVYISGGTVTVTAELVDQERRKARVRLAVYQGDGEAKSEGECIYTIFPEPLARRKLNYPGYEAFLPSEH
ncbi:MAG: PaaI family thioesterase [Spirochaetaceae bacterium]